MHVQAFDDSNLYRLPFSVEVRSSCVRTFSILLFIFSCMGVHLEVNTLTFYIYHTTEFKIDCKFYKLLPFNHYITYT